MVAIPLICLVAGAEAASPHAGEGLPVPAPVLRYADQRLTLDAAGISLRQVMRAIERETGLLIHGEFATDETVTAAFRDLPLEDGLRRVLAGRNLVFVYAKIPSRGRDAEPIVTLIELRAYSGARRTSTRSDESRAPFAPPSTNPVLAAKPRAMLREAPADPAGLARILRTDDDARLRKQAARALGLAGTPDVIAPLAQGLQDEDPTVREGAAEALGRTWRGGAVEPLARTLLADGDAWVREAAARALGRTWSDAGIDSLGRALRLDPQRGVREAAAQALFEIGDPGAVWSLIQALGDRHGSVREHAAQALGAIRSPLATAALMESWSRDPDPWVRADAGRALRKILHLR